MAFDGLELIEPNALYNLLQQSTVYSCLSDPNYLLLIDARIKSEYNESHVVTAKKAPKSEGGSFMVPYDAELECKQHIVVYDSNTSELNNVDDPAVACGRLLWEMGSRNPVKILRGGYEEFSALYPFLRTQKILFMPRELDQIKAYPVEIIPGALYIGNWRQGNAPHIQKDLKIKAHINVCIEAETLFVEYFKDPGPEHLHLQVEDANDADLSSHFEKACEFIEGHRQKNQAVLVFDYLGISRCATIVIAYLMKHNQWPLMQAYFHVQNCLSTLRPNRAFVQQLSDWEQKLFGAKATDIADPNY